MASVADRVQIAFDDSAAKGVGAAPQRAQRIADTLRSRHFGVFRDTEDILPTEEWKARLEQLIAEGKGLSPKFTPEGEHVYSTGHSFSPAPFEGAE